jgi:hypothetical protein
VLWCLTLIMWLWALRINLRAAPGHRAPWWSLLILTGIVLSSGVNVWREYHRCPICGESDPKKMRVLAESGQWIPWFLEGRDLVQCPASWHVERQRESEQEHGRNIIQGTWSDGDIS